MRRLTRAADVQVSKRTADEPALARVRRDPELFTDLLVEGVARAERAIHG